MVFPLHIFVVKSNSKHQASIWVIVVFCMNLLHLQSVKAVGIWWHLKWATKSNNTASCHLNVAHLCHTKIQCKNKTDVYSKQKLFSTELRKGYFLNNYKQIRSKVPMLLYFVGPKRTSGNCYVSCFLTDKTALSP